MSSLSRIHILAYCFLCLVWGSTWLAMRYVVHDVPPFKAAAIRFLVAGTVLLIWALFRRISMPKAGAQWNATLVLSLTMITLPYGFLFWAAQFVNSSTIAVLYSSLPLTVSLLTPLMTGRKVPRPAVFAMVLAFGGMLILFYVEQTASRKSLIGGLCVLIAMLLSAWSSVYAKKRLQDVDALVSTGLQLTLGSIGLLWATWALESQARTSWTRPAITGLLFLITFGSSAAFVVYYWLLQHMQAYQISTISLVIPVMAVLEGSLIGGEHVPLLMVVAMLVVLGSVGAVLFAESHGDGLISVRSEEVQG
ncbi:MAG TPA: EamA family transporter [Candidatus Saccharimonadales bacterium]|jgi:drug/metabolite transporter (DMT)-like permease|nr:EamA family transporter [Candidatus Saccharimonadales bacterium]